MATPFLWQVETNPAKCRLLDEWAVGPSAADIGCGTGAYAQHLRRRGLAVVAMDADDQVLDKEGIWFIRAGVPPIPLGDGQCDTMVLFDVLEHVRDEGGLLVEVRRVTRRRLILSVPSDDDGALPQYGICLLHHVDKTHQREYNPDRLRALLQAHGFRVVHLEAQRAQGMPFLVGEFFAPGTIGKIARVATLAWLRVLRRLRLVRVDLASDWFVVADVAGES